PLRYLCSFDVRHPPPTSTLFPYTTLFRSLGLRDKVTIVAASSKGLGRAVAEEFAREGARVVMCSRDEAAIRAAAEGVQRKTGAEVQWTVADVGTAEGCQKLVKTAVDKRGTIDVLVS